jgi:hypothetical protein
MKSIVLLSCMLILVELLGCSNTEDYLKPQVPVGKYNRENPACPGVEDVIEMRPTGKDWIIFRVSAKLPDEYHPEGTKLFAHFQFAYRQPDTVDGTWPLFPSAEEKERQKQLFEKRESEELLITASSPFASIVLPDGGTTNVSLPFFEKAFNHKEAENPHTLWGPEVLISPRSLENFKVIFPEIFLNGRKLDIPPVEFGKSRGTYGTVLNC